MAISAGIIGPYDLLEAVGRGAMGVVYRGLDRRSGETVAVKILSSSRFGDPGVLSRFRREARILAALRHPSIASFRHFGEDDMEISGITSRGAYLVMEWVSGEDLKVRLSRERFASKEIVSVATQVAEALEAAHVAGVVHRDLKPGNIRLTSDGSTKVLDFGLAKILDDAELGRHRPPTYRTEVGTLLGTAAYMSPEQLFGLEVDPRSDLFSLGVIMYEMATGVLPFRGRNIVLMLDAISSQEPAPPRELNPEVSVELERLVLGLLAKDVDDRIPSAAVVVEALATLRT